MDRQLPSIDCFIKHSGERINNESMTDLTKLFDLEFLTNSLMGEQAGEGNENSYCYFRGNDKSSFMPNPVKFPSFQVTSYVHENVERVHYSYQDDMNSNSPDRVIYQDNSLYQEGEGSWTEELESSWGNINHRKFAHEIEQGPSHSPAQNYAAARNSFPSHDQINAYGIKAYPSSTTNANTRLEYFDNSPAPPDWADQHFEDNPNSVLDRNLNGCNRNGEFALLDISHCNGDSLAFQGSSRVDIEQHRNFPKSYPEGLYTPAGLESPNNIHDKTAAAYAREACNTMYKDNVSSLHDFHIVNDNHHTNSNDINNFAFNYGSYEPYNAYEDYTRLNNDNNHLSQNAITPAVSLSDNTVTDTGQTECNNVVTNGNDNNRCHSSDGSEDENHFHQPGTDSEPLPRFISLMEQRDSDSSMSSASSSASSGDGGCKDLLDDLVRDLLNSKGKKKEFSYIALISRAILSSPEKRMLLSDIYDYISKTFKLDSSNSQSWRNSVRHNLSLNECFVKHERAGKGRGRYWSIHPACIDDFAKGDFRRRQARRLAQRNMMGRRRNGNRNQEHDKHSEPDEIRH